MKYKGTGYDENKPDVYTEKNSITQLGHDSLVWLNFDIVHGKGKKEKIFFSCDTNKKKYYLNDTIQINNAAYKIVGLVYNDSLPSYAIYGPSEQVFQHHSDLDTLSKEYILENIEYEKFSTYTNMCQREYYDFTKAFHERKHYHHGITFYQYYNPLFMMLSLFRITDNLSIILVKI